jgi:HSP20 family protein
MLTLWNGFDTALADEFRRMDRRFNKAELFRPARRAAAWPRIDLVETAEAFELTADVPGLTADDVKVMLHDGVLSLEAQQESEAVQQDEDKKIIHRERRHTSFARRFRLGADVDEASVSATVKDGVLTVLMPKKPEVQPKQIAVQAN